MAKERQKELLPRKLKANTDPWKDANTHTYYCEDDIHRLPVCCLRNAEIYRMNLLPRSYDERVKTEVHNRGFKLSSNSIGNFGVSDAKLQTKDGYERLQRTMATFEKHCADHKAAEDHYRENKRQIIAAKNEPRWAYSKNQGGYLGTFVSDPNYLFKKNLEPSLDRTKGNVQDDSFKRTTKFGGQFRHEVGSII